MTRCSRVCSYKSAQAEPAPPFWRVTVNVEKPGDTFLDMRPWGKGVVWVNGHNLGPLLEHRPAADDVCPRPLAEGRAK